MAHRKQTTFLLIWVILWITIGLGIVEMAVRFQFVRVTTVMWNVKYEFDWQTLFRIKPNCHPDIGPFGNRLTPGTRMGEPSHPSALIGDSFAYGVNVKPDQTIAAELERLLGGKNGVYNFGVAGYGPDQSLLQLRRIVMDRKPGAVFLTIFPANDFNDLSKNGLFIIDADGRMRSNRSNALLDAMPGWRSLFLAEALAAGLKGGTNANLNLTIAPTKSKQPHTRFDRLHRLLLRDTFDIDLVRAPDSPLSRTKQALMRGVMAEIRDTLAARGIPLYVAIIPSYESMLRPDFFEKNTIPRTNMTAAEDLADTICRETRLTFTNMTPAFANNTNRVSFFDWNDRHLSPLGYTEVARAFTELRRQNPGIYR